MVRVHDHKRVRVNRDANFQDAEIVRSEERRGQWPRERPSGVQERRHFGGTRGNMSMSLYI